MEQSYIPPRQKQLAWNVVIMVGLVLLGVGLIVLANLSTLIRYASVFVAVAFLLVVPFFHVFNQYNQAKQIRYLIDDESLRIHWGVNKLSLPLKRIDWAHHLSEFEQQMPLPRWHLPGVYFNLFEVHGMGKTQFVATDPQRMILIKADECYVVVSPEDPVAFLARLQERRNLASPSVATIEEENLKSFLLRSWRDKGIKRWLIVSLVMLIVLWIVAGLMTALRQTVTWVTLEEVRAIQLLLLPIFGTFMWIVSLVLSFFILTDELAEKAFVHILLISTSIVCLILSVAGLVMAL